MKNIVRLSILLSSFVCLLLFACDRDEQKQYKGANKDFFPFDKDTLEVHPLGDSIEVTFVSDVDWTMSKSPNWFNVKVFANGEIKKGVEYEKGTYTIKFDINPYVKDEGEGDTRSKTITFINTSNKSDIASFDIYQKRAYIEVTFDEGKEEIDFDWNEKYEQNDSNSFEVKSSVEYEISIEGDSDKINVYHDGESLVDSVYYGGAEKDTVKTFTVAPVDYNFSKKENTATITITPIRFDVYGNPVKKSHETLKKTITVSQDNLIFAIIETADVQEAKKKLNEDNNLAIPTALSGFSELGYNYLKNPEDQQLASKSIVVALQDGANFKLEGVNNEEVKFNVCEDGEIDEIPVKYTRYDVCVLKPNPENEEHEIPVTISLTENDTNKAEIELTLVQNPYIFKLEKIDCTDDNFANKPEGEECKTYKLSTLGPWRRLESNNADWLQIGNDDDPTESQGDHEFTISINERNMHTQEIKSAELVFVAEFDDGVLHTDTLTVAQDKYLFEITDMDGNRLGSQKFTSFDTDERTFKIQSSGKWKIEKDDDAEWLTVSCNEGNGNGDITIHVEENGGEDDRTATIKLISVTHEEKGLEELREMDIIQYRP